ncbi:MAG TPA: dynamin family protein [Thermoanaerobaculia bacterium]
MVEPQIREFGASTEYGAFERNRQSLSSLTERLRIGFEKLGIEHRARSLARLRSRLDADRFRVMVLGEFKRGKSTMINALLGEEVLPAYAVPCTAVINEIKWGEDKRAVLHFRHPLPTLAPALLPREVVDHLRRAGDQPAPPLAVPIERLESYVVIPEPEKDQEESVAETPYARIEIFWPLELCRNGVEIIDSPGLNENATRARVAKEYIANVDAILFVMICSALGSESELRVIDHDLRGVGHEYLFFLCNRFDDIRPVERPRVIDFARKKLAGRTELGDHGIFFLSALPALEARLRNDPAGVEASGLPLFERELTRFLTQDRAKVKLLQPARELLHALDEARGNVIPEQRELLAESLASLEAKFREVEPQLQDAERSKEQILQTVERRREDLRGEVRLEAETFLSESADAMGDWVAELDLDTKVKLLSFHHKEQIEAVAKEICKKVGARFENEAGRWKDKVLRPLVEQRMSAMEETVNVQVERFLKGIRQLRGAFSKAESGPVRPRWLDRGKLSEAGLGASQKSLLHVQVRTGAVKHLTLYGTLAGVVSLFSLPLAIPVILVALYSAHRRGGSMRDKVKEEVAKSLVKQFRKDLGRTAQAMADDASEPARSFADAVARALDHEISTIREQMKTVLEAKNAGELQVQAKKRLLSELEAEMREIDRSVEDLIFAVAGH